jgi:hypothetical protein
MLNGIGQREGIPAQQVDVVEYQRRETRKILGFYWETLSSRPLKGGIDVDGVPEHDNVDDQPQRPALILLPLPIALTYLTAFAVEDGACEFVAVFSSIQLG